MLKQMGFCADCARIPFFQAKIDLLVVRRSAAGGRARRIRVLRALVLIFVHFAGVGIHVDLRDHELLATAAGRCASAAGGGTSRGRSGTAAAHGAGTGRGILIGSMDCHGVADMGGEVLRAGQRDLLAVLLFQEILTSLRLDAAL